MAGNEESNGLLGGGQGSCPSGGVAHCAGVSCGFGTLLAGIVAAAAATAGSGGTTLVAAAAAYVVGAVFGCCAVSNTSLSKTGETSFGMALFRAEQRAEQKVVTFLREHQEWTAESAVEQLQNPSKEVLYDNNPKYGSTLQLEKLADPNRRGGIEFLKALEKQATVESHSLRPGGVM